MYVSFISISKQVPVEIYAFFLVKKKKMWHENWDVQGGKWEIKKGEGNRRVRFFDLDDDLDLIRFIQIPTD